MYEKNISDDRKRYLRKIRTNKILVILTQLSILILFLVLWEVLANKKIIDSFITSQPSRILDTFLNLSSNGLLKHLGVTLTETLIGFVSGVVLGVLIAILLWWSKFLAKVSEPFLVILNSLPKVALRTSYYCLGRSRNGSYYYYGSRNFAYCNHTRNFKWLFKYRQRANKNGSNF